MDVNGSKYHLLHGRGDWGKCIPAGSEQTLADLWAQPDDALLPALEWNCDHLRLRRLAPRFRHAPRHQPFETLPINARRGAARDQYGHFYWINEAEDGIRFLANGAQTSVLFWSSRDAAATCQISGEFAACTPASPASLLLRGLTVTTRHYLVVGNISQAGILIFDLHRGGPPRLLLWGDATPFAPWDMAATPDGGLLILDRANRRTWQLDEHFRLTMRHEQGEATLFQPKDAGLPPTAAPPTNTPLGFALPAAVVAPISIETGPEGHLLILDSGADAAQPSTVHELTGATLVHSYSLKDAILVSDPDQPPGTETAFSISAHDFAYVECCAASRPGCDSCLDLSFPNASRGSDCAGDSSSAQTEAAPIPLLFVAARDGNQVVAFLMDRDPLDLTALPDFLPLRRFVGKALPAYGGKVYYDFQDRFVPLQVLVECHFAGAATIHTPLNFVADLQPADAAGQALAAAIPGRPLDSNIPGCVWHRLLLDANIPLGTAIYVRARAADDLELLDTATWSARRHPYLRSNGAEVAFYTPPAFVQPLHQTAAPDSTARAGTWELLLQEVNGRYLQVELALEGTGRATPQLYALRVWYPRFSYLDHYLPAIYREETLPASFLDRWLANFEGFYTVLEEQIEHLPRLLDARTAPVDALEWLACWFGLTLDPLWQEQRRRFFIQHAFQLYGMRGTVPGLEIALRLYVEANFGEWLFDPVCWGQSKVRIIEQFMTAGDGTAGDGAPLGDGTATGDFAHRFSVLIPHDISVEDEAMVERIIHLERPAHTEFELKRYWDLFRVGEARLGLDTQLGDSAYLSALILGVDTLGVHYLAAAYPNDVKDRLVLARDRLGDLPEL